jgi:hypothetical protein
MLYVELAHISGGEFYMKSAMLCKITELENMNPGFIGRYVAGHRIGML